MSIKCFINLTEYREAFELFDKGTDKIYYFQVAHLVRALGEEPTNFDVLKVLGYPNEKGNEVAVFHEKAIWHLFRVGFYVAIIALAYPISICAFFFKVSYHTHLYHV